MMNPQENIVSQFSTLSPELQRAAEFCLQNVNILVVQSMRAFAAQAGVKPATLLRLAQRLGFSGWGELKDAFIDDLGLRNDTYVSKAKKLVAKDTQSNLYEEVFQAHQANLVFTGSENQQAMPRAVTLLDEADNVYICGFRASFPIAWSLYYVYRLFNRRVSLIDGLASNIEVFTRELTARDCVHQFCPLFTRVPGCPACGTAGWCSHYRHHRLTGLPFSSGCGVYIVVFN